MIKKNNKVLIFDIDIQYGTCKYMIKFYHFLFDFVDNQFRLFKSLFSLLISYNKLFFYFLPLFRTNIKHE